MPIVLADFVPLPRQRAPLSLALAPTLEHVLSGHVRLLSQLRANALDGSKMIDRGTFHCPCEIDIDLSKLFERAGPSYAFDFFFEPRGELEARLDVTRENASFVPLVGPFEMATGVRVDAAPSTLACFPLARFLRWRVTAPGGAAADVTFAHALATVVAVDHAAGDADAITRLRVTVTRGDVSPESRSSDFGDSQRG